LVAADTDQSAVGRLEERIERIERERSRLDRLPYETQQLEKRLDRIEDDATAGIGLFVSGILCALWAQYTRRSAWLWFFFGLILAPIALIAMVWKNASGLASGELRYWTQR
jgi:hypothetical protein